MRVYINSSVYYFSSRFFKYIKNNKWWYVQQQQRDASWHQLLFYLKKFVPFLSFVTLALVSALDFFHLWISIAWVEITVAGPGDAWV